jgi:hypothetical protein
MKTASLFLASAGIVLLAASGASAQAPVEYVKVCSLYGNGFYYVPGTDVCLKIGGYARAEFGSTFGSGGSANEWGFTGTLHPEFDARTETMYGMLRAYLSLDLEAKVDNAGGTSTSEFSWDKDEAYLQIGPFLGGWTTSTFDYTEAYTYVDALQSDTTTLQGRFTWLTRGYTVSAAIENPHDRDLGSDFPAFVVSFSPTADWGFTGSAALAGTPYGLGVAAQVGFEVPVLVNASVRGVLALAHNAQSYVGLEGSAPGFAWSGALSGRMALSTGLNLVGQVSFADGPTTDGEWQIVGGVHYAATQQLEIGGELFHKRSVGSGGQNGFLLRAQFDF